MAERRLTYSIIIPVYNKWTLTAGCLDALAATLGALRADGQVIVVDDASTDETPAALARRTDVDCIIRHEANTGFQGAAVDGVAAATGEVIVFLNNDTTPQAGWLDALFAELADESVGVAGSMFLFPDGRVQEFGGIVWRDASAYHIGARLDPSDPLFSRPRDVDYVSGAGMAMRKSLWDRVGGFDPDLKPAYYEDTDLCMSVRAAGKRVVVTPRSRIVHIMGGSKDVDPRKSHDTMMSVNREKFHAKWKTVLDREHWPPHPYFIEAASNRAVSQEGPPPPLDPAAKRLLFVYAIVPQYDRQSGDRRLYEMMRTYRDGGHAVTLLALLPDAVQAEALERAGIQVWHGDVQAIYSEKEEQPLERRLAGAHFDTVYLGSPQIARLYLPLIRSALPQATVITDAIDLNFHRMHRDRLVNKSAADLVALPLDRQWEMETYASSDALTSVSSEEAALLRAGGISAPIEIVSNFYHSAIEPRPFAGRLGAVIVVNMAHHPNLDALQWFFSEVWPRTLAIKPDLQLTVCGNGTDGLNFTVAQPNVAITGYLPSMDPVFQHARVNIAPLRVGAGVKGKVTEAMRNGLPTVTTPIGAEGLGADSSDALLVETDPERFAQAIVALHEDGALWNRLSARGQAVARERFSREANVAALERLVQIDWRAVHVDEPPVMQNIARAFEDPAVAVASFNAGEHAQALTELLRCEPSVGALAGRSDRRRISFSVAQAVPSLVLTRAAFQWAHMRGACGSVSQLLLRMQEGGLLIGCTPELPAAQWHDNGEEPLIVDVTSTAAAAPERLTAIVEGVRPAANCRLRIVPAGDLSTAMPAEVVVSAGIDGASNVRLFDGPVTAPPVFGLFKPNGPHPLIAIDPAATVHPPGLEVQVRQWAANRSIIVGDASRAGEIHDYFAALVKAQQKTPARAVIVARSARALQMAWANGIPATIAFSGLPAPVPERSYVYATGASALERLVDKPDEALVFGKNSRLLAVRVAKDDIRDFDSRRELFDSVTPDWLRTLQSSMPAMRSSTAKTVVFVLGMHRSGTSLATAILHTAGVRLSEDLMAPNQFNSMGYFESSSIAEVHDRVLSAMGSSWKSSTTIAPFPQDWWKRPEIEPLKQELIGIVARELDAGDYVWGFKDPRTARLLPLWLDIVDEMGLEPRFLLAIRDPRDVSQSLFAREKLESRLSELLWLEHNAGVLSVLGSRLHAVVDYDKWFVEPIATAIGVLQDLGLPIPPEDRLKAALDEIVSAGLRHHRSEEGEYLLPLSGSLYRALAADDRVLADKLAAQFSATASFASEVASLASHGAAAVSI